MDSKIIPILKDDIACPLCPGRMTRRYHVQRNLMIFACDIDGIAIRVDDPFVNRWDQAAEKTGKVPCPNPRCDETPMRVFYTSVGFMKAKCPKCGATTSNKQVDDAPKEGTTPENPGLLQ